jgi:hypothetical protein
MCFLELGDGIMGDPAKHSPKLKRRRWLIVTVVALLLASVAWWYWPRGDVLPKRMKSNDELPSTSVTTYEERLSTSATAADIHSDVATTRVVVSSSEYLMSSRLAGVLLTGEDGHDQRLPRPRVTYWVTGKITNVKSPFLTSPSVAGEVATFTVDVSRQNVWVKDGQKVDSLKVRFMPSIDSFESGRWACLGFDQQGQFVDLVYPVRPMDESNHQPLPE